MGGGEGGGEGEGVSGGRSVVVGQCGIIALKRVEGGEGKVVQGV